MDDADDLNKKYSDADDSNLSPEEAEVLRAWWVELRRSHGMTDALSDPDAIAEILRALSGDLPPRRNRGKKD